MKLLLLSTAVALLTTVNTTHAQYTTCANPSLSDPDGDGWGWENNESCIVDTATPPTDNTCIDPDGDGWGWDGTESCLVDDNNPPDSTSIERSYWCADVDAHPYPISSSGRNGPDWYDLELARVVELLNDGSVNDANDRYTSWDSDNFSNYLNLYSAAGQLEALTFFTASAASNTQVYCADDKPEWKPFLKDGEYLCNTRGTVFTRYFTQNRSVNDGVTSLAGWFVENNGTTVRFSGETYDFRGDRLVAPDGTFCDFQRGNRIQQLSNYLNSQ